MDRDILGCLVAPLALAVTLSGCGQADAPAPAPSEAAMVPGVAAPDAKPGLSGSAGRLVLPAVAGRPGVAYFMLRNGSDKPTALVSVNVVGAGKSEMHETKGGSMAAVKSVPLAVGGEVAFAPGGLHVMLFDLEADVAAGSTREMTLTFEGGDKLSMPLMVETMGGAMSDMHEGAH